MTVPFHIIGQAAKTALAIVTNEPKRRVDTRVISTWPKKLSYIYPSRLG